MKKMPDRATGWWWIAVGAVLIALVWVGPSRYGAAAEPPEKSPESGKTGESEEAAEEEKPPEKSPESGKTGESEEAAEEEKQPEGKQVGGGKDEKVVVRIGKDVPEPWRLPVNYRNPDGSFNQEALVAQQRKRLGVLNDRLVARFRLAETKHYLVFSDAGPKMTAQFAKWSEALYMSLCRQFGISPRARVWDGKCLLMIFGTRRRFLDHAREFDGFDASLAGAYFATEARAAGEPQLIHICMPVGTHTVRRLQEVLAHEGTHAFFQLYKRPVDLPVWLHEGLAEFITVVNDRGLRPGKTYGARYLVRHNYSVSEVFSPSARSLSYIGYSVAYTAVDFLVTAGRPKFRKFIDGLKAGKDQDTALKEAYGFDMFELERRWRRYVKEYLPRHP